MELRSDLFTLALNHFSSLYGGNNNTIRRLLKGIGLNDNLINYQGNALDTWTSVIEYVNHNDKFENLILFIKNEYDNAIVNSIIDEIKNNRGFIQSLTLQSETETKPSASKNLNILNCVVSVSRIDGMGHGNGCFISKNYIITVSYIFDKEDRYANIYGELIGNIKARIIERYEDISIAILQIDNLEHRDFLNLTDLKPCIPENSAVIGYDYDYMKPIIIYGSFLIEDPLYYYYQFPYGGKGLSGSPVINHHKKIVGLFSVHKMPYKDELPSYGIIKSEFILEAIKKYL